MRLSTSTPRVCSNRRRADCWNRRATTAATITRAARLQPTARSTSRRARDGLLIAPSCTLGARLRADFLRRADQAVAEAADGLDPVGADLLAHAADEHLDGVGVAVEVLVVQVLDQLGATDHPALVHDQVVQQPIFQ